jgi:hypothetical protein
VGVALGATIDASGFYVERPVEIGVWDFITSARRHGKNWLLLSNSSQEQTVSTGRVDDNFAFKIKKLYPNGSVSFPWQVVVTDGLGHLLMIGLPIKGEPIFGFGQVLDDGTFVEWWRTPFPNGMYPYRAFGLKDAHAWYINDPHVKHAQILSTRRFVPGLRNGGIVVDGDLIYFQDQEGTTEICVLDRDHRLVTIKRTEFDHETATPEGYFAFDGVVSTPGAHLCFSNQTLWSSATVRVLGRNGLKMRRP